MDNLSLRQKTRSALDRIDAVESTINELVSSLNGVIQQLNARLGDISEKIQALTDVVGAENVTKALDALAQAKAEKQLASAKEALADALTKGHLVSADSIGENSLVVGREFDKDGALIPPGRIQLTFSGIKAEFQEKLKGQGFGFTVDTPTGGKFEVLEVYDFATAAKPTAPSEVVVEATASVDTTTTTDESRV